MTVIFQSHHQFEFCDKILRGLEKDDGDSLMVATSSQEISLASLKVLQILSPLLTEIVKTLPSSSIPLTLIVPDTDANIWQALMSLLTQGKVEVSLTSGISNIECYKENISALAKCLQISLAIEHVLEDQQNKLRVKKPEELLESDTPYYITHDINIVNNDYGVSLLYLWTFGDTLMTSSQLSTSSPLLSVHFSCSKVSEEGIN